MKFFAAASLLAATASAAAVPRTIYKVSDFTAGCVPHSVMCSYEFGIIQADNGESTPVKCSAFLQSDGLGTLPPVTNGSCEQSSRTWTVGKGEDGSLTLEVSQQISQISFQKGDHVIASDEIAMEQTGASQQQRYTGPAEFDLLYVSA